MIRRAFLSFQQVDSFGIDARSNASTCENRRIKEPSASKELESIKQAEVFIQRYMRKWFLAEFGVTVLVAAAPPRQALRHGSIIGTSDWAWTDGSTPSSDRATITETWA